MTDPLISVVVPVYNGERYLASALRSICEQNYSNLEILVIDDGSSDRSAEVARSFPEIKYHSQQNAGPAAARNLGIRLAQGDYLASLDQDDLWSPDKLQIQLDCFKSHPELEMVVGNAQPINERGSFISEPISMFTFGCALIRRKVFEKVGLPDDGLIYLEDTDWLLRCREAGVATLWISEPVLFYRRHEHNWTHDRHQEKIQRSRLEMVKRSLDRRRKGTGAPLLPPIRKR